MTFEYCCQALLTLPESVTFDYSQKVPSLVVHIKDQSWDAKLEKAKEKEVPDPSMLKLLQSCCKLWHIATLNDLQVLREVRSEAPLYFQAPVDPCPE